MPAGLFQNYFNTIQTPNTFKNRKFYSPKSKNIHKKIFSLQYRQNKTFSLDLENNIVIKGSVYVIAFLWEKIERKAGASIHLSYYPKTCAHCIGNYYTCHMNKSQNNIDQCN